MIIEAILKINPNAKVMIKNEDINSIQWLDGTTPIPKADIEAMIPTVETEIADAETAIATNKTSAQNKLKALGLTDAEIEAL
jgi:hypothetical protein